MSGSNSHELELENPSTTSYRPRIYDRHRLWIYFYLFFLQDANQCFGETHAGCISWHLETLPTMYSWRSLQQGKVIRRHIKNDVWNGFPSSSSLTAKALKTFFRGPCTPSSVSIIISGSYFTLSCFLLWSRFFLPKLFFGIWRPLAISISLAPICLIGGVWNERVFACCTKFVSQIFFSFLVQIVLFAFF